MDFVSAQKRDPPVYRGFHPVETYPCRPLDSLKSHNPGIQKPCEFWGNFWFRILKSTWTFTELRFPHLKGLPQVFGRHNVLKHRKDLWFPRYQLCHRGYCTLFSREQAWESVHWKSMTVVSRCCDTRHSHFLSQWTFESPWWTIPFKASGNWITRFTFLWPCFEYSSQYIRAHHVEREVKLVRSQGMALHVCIGWTNGNETDPDGQRNIFL